MNRLRNPAPFSKEKADQIRFSIKDEKTKINKLYYELRLIERYLNSNIEYHLWNNLKSHVRENVLFKKLEKSLDYEKTLQKLITDSPWYKSSNKENVVNLSKHVLTPSEEELLGLGLNFSLPHGKTSILDFVSNLEKWQKQKEGFQYSFVKNNLNGIIKDVSTLQSDYIPKRLLNAIKDLKKDKNLRITKADKGGKIVLLDVTEYKEKMKRLLNDPSVYKKLKTNPHAKMQKSFNDGLREIIKKYPHHSSHLSKYFVRLSSLPYAYGLPKIHKPNNPLRPIISNCNAPTYLLSKDLAKFLSPILGNFSDAHLKHNVDLHDRLKNIAPMNSKFVSFDVSSLFTNVPLDVTLDFLKRKLPHTQHDIPFDDSCTLDLIKLCTKEMYFEFDDEYYQQTFGTAMGNPLSPVLANLFLEHIESEKLKLYTGISPVLWVRYVDDILCLVPENFVVNDYLTFLNNIYPSLKFTVEFENDNKIPFLDVLIHNCKTKIEFSVYRKPTNSESYLHFYSYNALDIKLSLAQGLFLRALRICSPCFLEEEINHIRKSLKKCAYPDDLLNKALLKAKRTYHTPRPEKTEIDFKNSVIVPYTPHLEQFKPLLKSMNKNVIFKYNEKIGKKLCKNKLSNKSCDVGVYKIDCLDCEKVYVGETGRNVNVRVKEHKHDIVIDKQNSGIARHVHDTGHSFNFANTQVLYPSNDLSKRHIVEAALIRRFDKKTCNLNSGFIELDKQTSDFITNTCFKPNLFI